MANAKVKLVNRKRNLRSAFFVTLLLIFCLSSCALPVLLPHNVNAQTQYYATGTIASNDTNFYIVQGITAGDLVLVSINPIEGASYYSQLLAPNLTGVAYHVGLGGNPVSGSHSYQTIADASGNYLLKFWTDSSAFNYTITSSHPISTGDPPSSTPYRITGQIQASESKWQKIQGVKTNDLIMVSINPIEGASYYSQLLAPNLTGVAYHVGLGGNPVSGSHSYQTIADASGNYLLKFWTDSSAFNYTIKSSHLITIETQQNATATPISTTTPSPTATPIVQTSTPEATLTPMPAITAAFNFSPKAPSINESVTFDATNSIASAKITSYVWDFGDGTNETSINNTLTHIYLEQGNFNVTLTVYDSSDNHDSYTSNIAISSLPTRETLIVPVAIGTGAATTVAVGLAVAKVTASNAQVTSNISDLPRSEFQRFLNFLVGKEQEDRKKKTKGKEGFISSKKGELAAIAISVAIMTFIFSYVEANGMPQFFDTKVLEIIVPMTFLSSITVKIVSILTDTLCAQSCGVDKRYTLWPLGIITFILTGLFILFPFASPGITKTHKQCLSPKGDAMLTVSRVLLLLTLSVPFAALAIFGYGLLADAGLLSVLTAAFFSLVPIDPLPGKAIASYKKALSVVVIVLAGVLLYGFMLRLLPSTAYLAVGILCGVVGGMLLYKTRKSVLSNEPTPALNTSLPPPPPPPPPI